MVDVDYKRRATELVKKARQKGLITKYSDFCKSKESKDYAVSKQDVVYYTSKVKGAE